MLELDDARQEMVWRCLDFIYPTYTKRKQIYEEPLGIVSRYELEFFMQKQHKRFLGFYTSESFVRVLTSLGVVKSCETLKYGRIFQRIRITLKGLKFLEDCKLSPEIAWINLKGEK